ncbi:MAG: hypothetical protein ACLP01_20665 [Solirubrobacteraceae bacterium]
MNARTDEVNTPKPPECLVPDVRAHREVKAKLTSTVLLAGAVAEEVA